MDKLKGKTIKLIGYNKHIDMYSTDILFNIVKIHVRPLERIDMTHELKADYIYLLKEEEQYDILRVKQILAEDDEGKLYVVITNCKVYVMNEDGKTIDTI